MGASQGFVEEDVGFSSVVDDVRIDGVHIAYVLRGYHFPGISCFEHPSLVEEDHPVRVLRRYVELVAHHYHGQPAAFGELLQKACDLHLVLDVQIGGGFVQEEHLRLLHQTSGYHDLLTLPCAELGEGTERQVVDLQPLQNGVHSLQVVLSRTYAGVRMPSHDDHVHDAEGEVGSRGVGDVSHLLGQVLEAELVHPFPVHQDLSF